MRKWLSRAGIAFAVLFAAWVVYIFAAAWHWQISIGRPLERELGFQHGTPYIQEAGRSWLREVLTVDSIVPGGTFDRAGFKSGDVILGLSINGLFQSLHRGRGELLTIRVVEGGDGPPIDQRPERAITFEMPR